MVSISFSLNPFLESLLLGMQKRNIVQATKEWNIKANANKSPRNEEELNLERKYQIEVYTSQVSQ